MGVIEEMDQGTSGFTLRQLDPTDAPSLGAVAELPFRFEDHLYDAVMDAFTSCLGGAAATACPVAGFGVGGDPSSRIAK
jgi:hypothetical protein